MPKLTPDQSQVLTKARKGARIYYDSPNKTSKFRYTRIKARKEVIDSIEAEVREVFGTDRVRKYQQGLNLWALSIQRDR